MRLLIAGVFIFTVLLQESISQWRMSNQDIFAESYEFLLFGEYSEALPGFRALLRDDENNDHLSYLAAVCYLNIEGQRHRALPFLQQAKDNISPDHSEGSFEERSAPVEALYYLGIAYRLQYMFKESVNAFSELIELLEGRYDMQLIEREIEITLNAEMFYINSHETGILPCAVMPPVESHHRNLAISNDRLVAVYSEEQKFYDAVVFTIYNGYEWSRPRNITMQIGSDGLAYPVFLNHDGTELYLAKHDRFQGTNIYISRRAGNRWSAMEKLGGPVSSSAFEQHASVTADGSALYFCSNRSGGEGGFDIYRSFLDENGEWGPAENLGYPVNTPYDDSFPNISPCGNILYFSSKGHTGMGGYDIFVSHKQDNGTWSAPRNLGHPVNTPFNDLILLPSADGQSALLSLRSPEWPDPGKYELIRLHDVEMTPSATSIISWCTDSGDTGEPAAVNVEINRTFPYESTFRICIERGREYTTKLPWGEYNAVFTAPGHDPVQQHFMIPEYYPDNEYLVSAKLSKGAQEADYHIIEITPVFFGFDSNDPGPASLEIISVVAGFLNEFENVAVELKGYTDSMGPELYNKYLAGLRVETVASVLHDKGVEAERITVTPVGMGNYIAINTDCEGRDSVEGRRYNRRVEFVFINLPGNTEVMSSLEIPDNLIIK